MHLLGDRSGTLRFGTKTGIHSTVSSGHRVAQENAFNFTHAQGARSLAAILFERTKRADQEGVYREDFQRQLSAKIASNAFALFDGNWDGRRVLAKVDRQCYGLLCLALHKAHSAKKNSTPPFCPSLESVKLCALHSMMRKQPSISLTLPLAECSI